MCQPASASWLFSAGPSEMPEPDTRARRDTRGMPELMRGPEWPLLIALAVGLLIGADRERRKNEDRSHRPAGVRTFTLVAVLGGAAAAIGHGMDILAGVFVAAGALAGFALRGQADRDLAT